MANPTYWLLDFAAIVLLAAAISTPAPAATIVRDGDRLVFTGNIAPGDDTAFAAAVDSDQPPLSGPGGMLV